MQSVVSLKATKCPPPKKKAILRLKFKMNLTMFIAGEGGTACRKVM